MRRTKMTALIETHELTKRFGTFTAVKGVSLRVKAGEILALLGPNGAGKTTFARQFLPYYAECLEFVNADLIANGLSPFFPERAAIRAGRLMLQQIHLLADHGRDFGFETTLSGKTYVRFCVT